MTDLITRFGYTAEAMWRECLPIVGCEYVPHLPGGIVCARAHFHLWLDTGSEAAARAVIGCLS